MKKRAIGLMMAVMMLSTVSVGCSKKAEANEGYTPKSTVDWICTSGAGGGSDIFSRMITDIMVTEDMVDDSNFVVNNKTDGSGEIGRNEVAHLTGDRADNTLLTFNSGDLMPMVTNTPNRSSNFKIIAIMAVDKQLLFKGKSSPYESFAEVIEAVESGTNVVIGGSKGDDVATYNALVKELGVSAEVLKYITYDSTSEAISAILGGHVDFVISKPAASSEYVTAGDLAPVLAFSTERYTGNLADAPILSEVGDYEDVEVPVWRGVAAAANMSDEAIQFYSDALEKVSETETWKTEYLEANKLIANFMNHDEATEYVTQYEADYMELNGIK